MPFAVRAYDAGIPYIQMADPSFDAPVYVGWADPGTPTSVARWRIYMLTAGTLLFANGSIYFDQVWDDRADATKIIYK